MQEPVSEFPTIRVAVFQVRDQGARPRYARFPWRNGARRRGVPGPLAPSRLIQRSGQSAGLKRARGDRAFSGQRGVTCRSFGTIKHYSSFLALPPQTPLSRPCGILRQVLAYSSMMTCVPIVTYCLRSLICSLVIAIQPWVQLKSL